MIELGAQADAFQQLRDDEAYPVLLADIVNSEDVGMIERGDGARFPLEAAQAIGILRKIRASLSAQLRGPDGNRAR